MTIKSILIDLGYQVNELANEYRCRPIYRESDNNNSLRIKKSNGSWVDFGISKSGNFLELVQISLGLKDESEALNYLDGSNFSYKKLSQEVDTTFPFPSYFDEKEIDSITKNNSYWINRGISERVLNKFSGGISTGKMSDRYVFPIFNEESKIIGFSGRDILKSKSKNRPKWKHIGNKSFWIYPLFLNRSLILEKKSVILVESIGDCLSLFEVGIENVLVTFGTFLSKEIIKKLIELDVEKIYISLNNDFDNNNIGNEASQKIIDQLSCHFDIDQLEIKLPEMKDFNEMLVSDKDKLAKFYDN